MFPIAHPGLAYLLYAGWRRTAGEGAPTGPATLALVGGALLPDLLDQPLYHLGVTPSGRTIGHSLLLLGPVAVAGALVVRRSARPDGVGAGFAVGLLSHPVADATFPLLLGRLDELGFLLWPTTYSPPYVGNKPLFDAGPLTVTTLWVDVLVLALGVVAWVRDGRPGFGTLRSRVRR